MINPLSPPGFLQEILLPEGWQPPARAPGKRVRLSDGRPSRHGCNPWARTRFRNTCLSLRESRFHGRPPSHLPNETYGYICSARLTPDRYVIRTGLNRYIYGLFTGILPSAHPAWRSSPLQMGRGIPVEPVDKGNDSLALDVKKALAGRGIVNILNLVWRDMQNPGQDIPVYRNLVQELDKGRIGQHGGSDGILQDRFHILGDGCNLRSPFPAAGKDLADERGGFFFFKEDSDACQWC